MNVDEALTPLRALVSAYCADARVTAGGAFPMQRLILSVILWDGDEGKTEGDRQRLSLRLLKAVEETAPNLGASRWELSLYFQSRAQDPQTDSKILLALSAIFPDDVRANPAAALAALADPVAWRGVLETA